MQQVQALGNVAATTVAYKQYDMEGINKLVVRRLNLPLEYDNKGYPKKYSKEDLDRLKGKDKTLPGYEAGLLDLQTRFNATWQSPSRRRKTPRRQSIPRRNQRKRTARTSRLGTALLTCRKCA
jgi:hypothetical protein